MNKQTFYREIKSNFKSISKEEVNKITEYFDEIINDKMEMGYSEEEAIESLGNVRNITNVIKANTIVEKTNYKETNYLKNFLIILGICTTPILIPIGIAFFVVFVSILIAMISMFVAFSISSVIVFVTTIVGTIQMIIAGDQIASILMIAGVALVVSAILMLFAIFVYKISAIIFNAINKVFSKLIRNKTKKEGLSYV